MPENVYIKTQCYLKIKQNIAACFKLEQQKDKQEFSSHLVNAPHNYTENSKFHRPSLNI